MNVNDSNDTSHTDWVTLEAMTDEEIDYSEIPPLTDAFFEKATLRIPANQAPYFIQLDSEVLEWYQAQKTDCKTLINSVLRQHMEASRTKQAS